MQAPSQLEYQLDLDLRTVNEDAPLADGQTQLHNYNGQTEEAIWPDRPLKVAVLTSVREHSGDGAGTLFPGTAEWLLQQIHDGRSELAQALRCCVDICGVIHDDITRPVRAIEGKVRSGDTIHRGYASTVREALANPSMPWILNRDLRNGAGELISSNTAHIPSDWRRTTSGLRHQEIRAALKANWEHQVADTAEQMGADVLLSDELMLLAYDLLRRYPGRFLNVHPAILRQDWKWRLPGDTVTSTSIKRAVQGEHFWAGATLHFADDGEDTGPIIADGELTRVCPAKHGTPDTLRPHHWVSSNHPVAASGLVHYATRLYPNIGKVHPETESAKGHHPRQKIERLELERPISTTPDVLSA